MKRILKIGAFACLGIGGFAFFIVLSANLPSSLSEFVIAKKYEQKRDSSNLYRLFSERSPGGSSLDSAYSKSFYDSAQVGDHLWTTMNGYSSLIRDGKLVKREISDQIIFPCVYALIALIPLLLFVHFKSVRVQQACLICAGVAEAIVFGGLLLTFIPAFS